MNSLFSDQSVSPKSDDDHKAISSKSPCDKVSSESDSDVIVVDDDEDDKNDEDDDVDIVVEESDKYTSMASGSESVSDKSLSRECGVLSRTTVLHIGQRRDLSSHGVIQVV